MPTPDVYCRNTRIRAPRLIDRDLLKELTSEKGAGSVRILEIDREIDIENAALFEKMLRNPAGDERAGTSQAPEWPS